MLFGLFAGVAALALLQAAAPSLDTTSSNRPANQPAVKPAAKSAQKVPAEAAPSTLTVTGKRPDFTSEIDRRSYSVANDLQKTSGSLADALRNVPQVEVDVQGNVKLRGDANVTILVDGKPAPMFNGQSRADVLQQMPADQIERVEVITTPSAQFRPDGTGGIINLITKKGGKPPPFSGSLKANVGTKGRYNVGGRMARSFGALTLSGGVSDRADRFTGSSHVDRQIIDGSGHTTHVAIDTHSPSASHFDIADGQLQYQFDPKTRLNASTYLFQGRYRATGATLYGSDATTGPLAQDFTEQSITKGRFAGRGLTTNLTRTLPGDGHELSASLNLSRFSNTFQSDDRYSYTLPAPTQSFQRQHTVQPTDSREFKLEYKETLPGAAKLVAGYQFNEEANRIDKAVSFGTTPVDAVLSSVYTNLFKVRQSTHALYATVQKEFGPLAVMPGLRIEDTEVRTEQVTTRLDDRYDYLRAYPTLHLGWRLDDMRQLTFGYSRRVQRPQGQTLNPFRIYNGPLSYTQGDPRLKPAVTDSFEGGFEYRHRTTYTLTTIFFRRYKDEFTSITEDLGAGVTLNTTANLGRRDDVGVELVSNREIIKALTVNASLTALHATIDPGAVGFEQKRSGTVVSGRATLNWTVDPVDFVQLGVSASGKSPSAQGRSAGYASINFGYRHKIDDRLAFVVTAQNPFLRQNRRNETVTPTLVDRTTTRFDFQPFYMGLTFALGATPKRPQPESFDFGGGGAPGGGGPR